MKQKNKVINDDVPRIPSTEKTEIELLKEETETLKAQIAALTQIKEDFERDAMYSVYFANNRKVNQFARMLNSLDISKSSDLDTYVKLTGKQPAIVEALNKMRREYLKLDEKELDAKEGKDIPLIERQGMKQK